MRRLWSLLRSLRWKLTLAYVALLAVLLTGFGVYQAIALRSSLITARVSQLQDDVSVARTVIAKTAVVAGQRPGKLLCSVSGVSIYAGRVATTLGVLSGRTVSVVVYDAGLASVAQQAEGSDLPHLSPEGLQTALHGSPSSAEVVDGTEGRLLVVGFPVAPAHSACGVVQLSTSMAPLEKVLADQIFLLLVGSGVALLAALVIGLLITSRALRPLRRLTATSEQLAAGDLRARSRLTPRQDEVGVLAQSFDNMADRIESAFTAQRESEEQTRRFIADASHELRTPVTSIKGYLDVIQRGAARDPAALDHALGAMSREAERMRNLVTDLLSLARLDANRQLTPESIDLNDFIARHLDEGVPGMPAELARDFQPGEVLARADPNALATVIRNLMVNACKYAPGAKQTWGTRTHEGRAWFMVRDEGPGIPAADLPHLFDRFYRGEKTRAREEGGSGLGLSIVQGLVRAMGGDISVQSVEGQGTSFTVWLPPG